MLTPEEKFISLRRLADYHTLLNQYKQDKLVSGVNMDTTPTADSDNPITSNAVYQVMNDINTIVGNNVNCAVPIATINVVNASTGALDTGITAEYDVEGTGSLTISGSSTNDVVVYFQFPTPSDVDVFFGHGSQTGSSSTFYSYLGYLANDQATIPTAYSTTCNSGIVNQTINSAYDTQCFCIMIKANTTMSGVVFSPVVAPQVYYAATNDASPKPAFDNHTLTEYMYELEKNAFSGSYNDLTDKPALKTVATSGSYNDLTDKPTDPIPYLTFTGTASFTLETSNGKRWNGTIEYSTDKTTWNTWDGSSSTAISSGTGNVLYLRGKNNTHISATSYSNYSSFVFTTTGTIACTGDIRTLLDYEDPENTTMDSYCYSGMFVDCTSLTVAPALPATTLASYCYNNMFQGCTSLTVAPVLPATTLAKNCYREMFEGCTSLTVAPALPATTLVESCYYDMFYGCTSLTVAPALPATTLTDYCYQYMFNGCTSLTTIPALPATTLATFCYAYMFQNCTSLTVAPALPATTLANSCYYNMFNGCKSLIVIPVLPATTLADYCYMRMFNGCTNIKLSTTQTGAYQTAYRIPTSGSGTARTNSLTDMFTSTGGTFTGTPTINTTYYTCNFVML